MKIGFVIYGSLATVSGGYLYDRKLVAYLRAQGDQVVIISLPPSGYVRHVLDNLSFRLDPGAVHGAGLDAIIEDELVHPSVFAANLRTRRAHSRAPIISLVHNLRSSERRAAWLNAIYARLEKSHLASVDGYIFNSRATQASVLRLIAAPKPAVIAPPGGDRLGTLGLPQVQRRATTQGPLNVLFLANVTPLKGLDVLVDALERLPGGSYSLDVVGSLDVDKRYSVRMRRRAARLHPSVTFHGVLDGRPLADILERTHVVAIPSYYEGFGISYLEGMAFGAPAIGIRVGAVPGLITHGENGFLIESGDAASLAQHLETLAFDRSLLLTMSAAALRRFADSPTWHESAGMARRFIGEMIGRSAAQGSHEQK